MFKLPSSVPGYYSDACVIRVIISVAQRDSSFITEIRGYDRNMDSIILAEPNFIVRSIAEGPIKSTITINTSGTLTTATTQVASAFIRRKTEREIPSIELTITTIC